MRRQMWWVYSHPLTEQGSCYTRSVPTGTNVKEKGAQSFPRKWHRLIPTCSLPWRLAAGQILKFQMRLKRKEEALTGHMTRLFHHLRVSAPLYKCIAVSVGASLPFSTCNVCHDMQHDWLTQSGDCVAEQKLSPLIAFSEVIKMTSVTLCWLCVRLVRMKAGFWSPRWLRPFTPFLNQSIPQPQNLTALKHLDLIPRSAPVTWWHLLLSLSRQTPRRPRAPTWTRRATWGRAACAPYVETGPLANTTGRPAATAARASSDAASAKTTCTRAGEGQICGWAGGHPEKKIIYSPALN